ncbi:unnamed protein product [Parnassius apollo]|uniref:(apollo) hypothetical protein n=1 Tax=Parnassius apollo TaxID=110799 RepID=A0A8S3W0I6_PARAO|nr:unnamed protein product [Parnassius apollo]
MEEDDTGGTERQLIEDELARKQAELEELEQMRREAGFTPRTSLRRTPRKGLAHPQFNKAPLLLQLLYRRPKGC